MPPERLPVQVVGAVPCNNSYRHVEDFVVFELEEKNVCECAWRLLFKPVIALLRTAPSPSPHCLLPTLPGVRACSRAVITTQLLCRNMALLLSCLWSCLALPPGAFLLLCPVLTRSGLNSMGVGSLQLQTLP